MDYGPDYNVVSGFTERWVDRDRLLAKAYEVYTLHEMSAATRWAQDNGTEWQLRCEEWWMDKDGDGNAPRVVHWASQLEVWGKYELRDGVMVHGWHMDDAKWDWRKLVLEVKVHGDGMFGDDVWINVGNKLRGPVVGKCWCMVVLTPMPIAICGMKSRTVHHCLGYCLQTSFRNRRCTLHCQNMTSRSFSTWYNATTRTL